MNEYYTILRIFNLIKNFFLVGLVVWLIWLQAKLFEIHSTYGVWKLASVLICKVQKKVTLIYLDIKVCIDVLVYIEHMYTYVYIKSHVQLFTGTCVWFLCTLSWSRQSGSSDNWNQSNLPFAIIISFIQDVKNTKSLLLFLRVFFHVGKVW